MSKIVEKHLELRFGKRVLCAGGCGSFVLPDKGECRKCRRKRVAAGRVRIAKASGHPKITPVFETMKEKFLRTRRAR